MGSRGTLWGLALIGVVLGGVLALGELRDEPGAALDRRVLPELSGDRIKSVTIESEDSPRIRLVMGQDGRLSIVEPVQTLVAPDAQDELVFTLRRLSFRRREAEPLRDPDATIVVELAAGRVELSVGAAIEATGQIWIGRKDRASSYVVDDYAVEVLLRGVDELRERSVWSRSPRRAARIELAAGGEAVVLEGPLAEVDGLAVRADPGALVRTASQLDRLRFESFQSPVSPIEGGLRARVEHGGGSQKLEELGPCNPTLVLVAGPVGTGCVDRATIDSLRETVENGRQLWDRDLFSTADVESIVLSAGGRRVEVEAHEQPARRWIAKLRSATGDQWVKRPGDEPTASVEMKQRDGTSRYVDVYPGPIAARRDEPVALRMEPEVERLLEPGPNLFRSRQLLSRDPSEVARIAVTPGATVERGRLVDEWVATAPPDTEADPDAVAAAARTLAQLTALEFIDGELGNPIRTIELDLDPTPMGEPASTHTLRIGAQCRATLDGDPDVFVLSPDACAALTATWWK